MKSLEEILNQEPVYINDWSTKEGVISDFEEEKYNYDKGEYIRTNDVGDVNILFASYSYANYSGDAWVLFEKDGELFEVNGSHCSCYGLEGQWQPEEVLLDELENRLLNGTFGEDNWSDNNFKKELCKFLDVEFVRNTECY